MRLRFHEPCFCNSIACYGWVDRMGHARAMGDPSPSAIDRHSPPSLPPSRHDGVRSKLAVYCSPRLALSVCDTVSLCLCSALSCWAFQGQTGRQRREGGGRPSWRDAALAVGNR